MAGDDSVYHEKQTTADRDRGVTGFLRSAGDFRPVTVAWSMCCVLVTLLPRAVNSPPFLSPLPLPLHHVTEQCDWSVRGRRRDAPFGRQ